MTKLRRMQKLNNVLMGALFVLAIGHLLMGNVLYFAAMCIALFFTFVNEKRIERLRRRLRSQHPRIRRSIR